MREKRGWAEAAGRPHVTFLDSSNKAFRVALEACTDRSPRRTDTTVATKIQNKGRLYLLLLLLILLAVGSYIFLSSDGVTRGLYDEEGQAEMAPEGSPGGMEP